MSPEDLLENSKKDKSLTPLQERFIKSGLKSLNDEEIFELLFSQHHRHGQRRKLAKECARQFGNLRGLLSASAQELREFGICDKCIFNIKILDPFRQLSL